MKRLGFLVVGVGTLCIGFAACLLNPQPLPPDNPDAAGAGVDAPNGSPDSATTGDAGFVADSEPPLGADAEAGADADAGVDAGDASAADASDASVDAPADTTNE